MSTLSGLLAGIFERRDQPTAAQRFEHLSLHSRYHTDETDLIVFSLNDNPRSVIAYRAVEGALEGRRSRLVASGAPYEDCHCGALVPNLFASAYAGFDLSPPYIIDFTPIKIYETEGSEFFLHLRNLGDTATAPMSHNNYNDKREQLLHAVNADTAVNVLHGSACGKAATADPELQQARVILHSEPEALPRLQACEALSDATYRSHSWRTTRVFMPSDQRRARATNLMRSYQSDWLAEPPNKPPMAFLKGCL